MSSDLSGVIRVLAVVAAGHDRICLRRMFQGFRWRGEFVQSCDKLELALESFQPDVVLTDSALADGESWRDVLRTAQERREAPPVIVTSRLADDRLWAEVLNLGGYDLLVSPYQESEVLHVVNMAWRTRQNGQSAAAAAGEGRFVA